MQVASGPAHTVVVASSVASPSCLSADHRLPRAARRVACSEQQLQANLAAATDPSYRGRDPFVAAFLSVCLGERRRWGLGLTHGSPHTDCVRVDQILC
jgi:hypothetical protein